jgi:hypothetical protein
MTSTQVIALFSAVALLVVVGIGGAAVWTRSRSAREDREDHQDRQEALETAHERGSLFGDDG